MQTTNSIQKEMYFMSQRVIPHDVRTLLASGFLSSLLMGCVIIDNSEPVVMIDEGEMCLLNKDADLLPIPGAATIPQQVDAGQRLAVTVSVPSCLSSSCDLAQSAQCTIARDGTDLIVRSELSYKPSGDELCSMDCIRLAAECESEPLDAGDYRVVFGEQHMPLTVPSMLTQPCL